MRRRSLLECEPIRVQPRVLEVESKVCPRCGRRVQARAPGVLPKFLYGNRLLTFVATQHLLYGQPLGRIEKQTGIGCGSLLALLHALARRLEPVLPHLIEQYRHTPVRHADETGWRTDGQNGYAWLFATPRLSLFRFRSTRSAAVPAEIFGPRRLDGVLVVDRYHAYNRMPCRLQYGYAHLLRDLKDLGQEFPDLPEVTAFVEHVAPLLSAAMHLRAQPGSRRAFLHQADRDLFALLFPAQGP